ncbi:Hypothetical predicted protein [Mytilus galloprovincialis]|uniref:Uncharacterized protein n=1 Tax=Mytilus galloprovincialis TaxID=29158 RepID=A0A8B6FQ05_MYTGA|nr:Hypothetical predicted protein [Mytilus galloprovincialis]
MRANMSGDNIDLNVFHYREKSIGPELPGGRKRNQSVSRVKRYRNRSSTPYRHTPKVEIPVKKDMKDELSQLVDVMSGQKLNDLPNNGTVQQQTNKGVMEHMDQIKKADTSDIARTDDLDVNATKIPVITTTPISVLTDSFKRLSLKDLDDNEIKEVKELKQKQRPIRQKVKREWRKEIEVPGRSQQQSILSNSTEPKVDRPKKRKCLTVSFSQTVDDKDTEEVLHQAKRKRLTVSNSQEVDNKDREDVFLTTKKEDVSQTTKTEDVSQTPIANTEDVSQTPITNTEDVSQTPIANTEDVSQTPIANIEDVSQTPIANTEDVSQTPIANTEDVLQTTETEDVFQTTNTEDVLQTTKTGDVLQTRKTEDVFQTTQTEDVFQTTKRKVRRISKDGASSKRVNIDKQKIIDQKFKPKVKNEVRYLTKSFKKLKLQMNMN